MRVVALVSDLMDRSRIAAAVPAATFIADIDAATTGAVTRAAVVVIDLARHGDAVATVRQASPDAFIVAFGSHVDDEQLLAARAAGADRVLPRSRFFRNPAAAMALEDGP
ncbi:MAG: DNA-binding response regulator [Acidimicrobiia bacterium]|nr:DNA-binding response regulator [Acidimicrobiia bacterium]